VTAPLKSGRPPAGARCPDGKTFISPEMCACRASLLLGGDSGPARPRRPQSWLQGVQLQNHPTVLVRKLRVAWWETPRPEVLKDLDDDLVLPLSEVVFRMMAFLYDYSEQQKDDRYKFVARIIGGAGTARPLFKEIVVKGQ
jgi:hypothetical protein